MQTFPITLLGHIAHGSYDLGTNTSAIECTHSILSYGNLPCALTRSRISKKLMQKSNRSDLLILIFLISLYKRVFWISNCSSVRYFFNSFMDFALSFESYFSNQFPSFCKTDLRETSAMQEIRITLCMVAVGHTKKETLKFLASII